MGQGKYIMEAMGFHARGVFASLLFWFLCFRLWACCCRLFFILCCDRREEVLRRKVLEGNYRNIRTTFFLAKVGLKKIVKSSTCTARIDSGGREFRQKTPCEEDIWNTTVQEHLYLGVEYRRFPVTLRPLSLPPAQLLRCSFHRSVSTKPVNLHTFAISQDFAKRPDRCT